MAGHSRLSGIASTEGLMEFGSTTRRDEQEDEQAENDQLENSEPQLEAQDRDKTITPSVRLRS